jgi:hypothetical protein
MKNKTILQLIVAAILIISGIFLIYYPKQGSEPINCSSLIDDFDNYASRSSLPILEDPNSLCYQMNMGSDFANLPKKWAIAKLVDFEEGNYYSLKFEGHDETGSMIIPDDYGNPSDYKIGEYYKIDMNNVCRSFFMMADSRYSSPIISTFVKPEKVRCE